MTDQGQWPLKKIREAYLDVLSHYNALYPILPDRKMETDEMPGGIDGEEDLRCCFIRAKLREVAGGIKEAADRSGNPETWQIGESLERLSDGLRNRVERALKFGI
jgi:hypothetical protein